jgi:hypothetical protein
VMYGSHYSSSLYHHTAKSNDRLRPFILFYPLPSSSLWYYGVEAASPREVHNSKCAI